MPQKYDSNHLVNSIRKSKDIDCLSKVNLDEVFEKGIDSEFLPCAVEACVRILYHYKLPLHELTAVVIGKSFLVGLPMARVLEDLCKESYSLGRLSPKKDKIINSVQTLLNIRLKLLFHQQEKLDL